MMNQQSPPPLPSSHIRQSPAQPSVDLRLTNWLLCALLIALAIFAIWQQISFARNQKLEGDLQKFLDWQLNFKRYEDMAHGPRFPSESLQEYLKRMENLGPKLPTLDLDK
jgi:hypothetical protein